MHQLQRDNVVFVVDESFYAYWVEATASKWFYDRYTEFGFTEKEVTMKCCTCGTIETLGKEEMFADWSGKPFKLITKAALVKERLCSLKKNK